MNPPYALKNRSLLSLDDLSARDLGLLLTLAHALKRERREGREQQYLRGLHIATLAAAGAAHADDPLATAAAEQGALVVHLGPQPPPQPGHDDRHELPGLLGRLYDAVEVRGMPRAALREFASRCSVPVYRDLGDAAHPARVVADLMSMQEQTGKPLGGSVVAWLGDAHSERGAALMQGALLMGMDLRIAAVGASRPDNARLAHLRGLAQAHGAHLSLHESAAEALLGCDVGCDFGCDDRQTMPLRPTPSDPPLPRRDRDTALDGNRVHAVKALLVATLA